MLDRNAVTPKKPLIFRLPCLQLSAKKKKKKMTEKNYWSFFKTFLLSASIKSLCLLHTWAFYLFNRKICVKSLTCRKTCQDTVKTSSVRAVNTSVDSTAGKAPHAVIVLCQQCMPMQWPTFFQYFAFILNYFNRHSCVVQLIKYGLLFQPRSTLAWTAQATPLWISQYWSLLDDLEKKKKGFYPRRGWSRLINKNA